MMVTHDKELAAKMEPRTSIPEKRLETIEKLAEAGIPVGVNVAPIIPGLTDKEIPEIIKQSASGGATFAGYTLLRLPYSIKNLFIEWLEREFPGRKNKILNKIREMRNGKLNESEFGKRFSGKGEQAKVVKNLFNLSCSEHGLKKRDVKLSTEYFRHKSNNQIEMF
jgi:DNA repair photolyase